jgi:CDP-glycerol glycerophosphotransferase
VRVFWQSFEGRYSDNPRALYQAWVAARPGDEHVWMADPDHTGRFPAGIETVPRYDAACVAALEAADLVIANTHTDVEWEKRPGTRYLQMWHGTPLKRIHHDVRWAPPGRLARLDHDVARWDLLLSPNAISTPRLRHAFGFAGELLETGYPRNDILLSADAMQVRDRVRAELGIAPDVTAVLYTPTWRDDVTFGGGSVDQARQSWTDLIAGVDEDECLLLRMHTLEAAPHDDLVGPRVRDVSHHADIAELYLAADVMITDYSSTMFDFAVTGKPLVYYVPDYERFRDEVRGFYFDLEPEAPGPLVRTAAEVWNAVRDRRWTGAASERYTGFRQRYCGLEDGGASERVLQRLWADQPSVLNTL